MQLSTFIVILASTAGVMGDLHKYGVCTSRIQPIGNPNGCPKKRDTTPNDLVHFGRSIIEGRAYADNAAATRRACDMYRNRNTGNKHWDRCPDCTVGVRRTSDPKFCVQACNSGAGHLGGDEWYHYCKKAGADFSEAY